MGMVPRFTGLLSVALALVACATPAPTATPTTAPMAAPTPTKAATATPTKRPLTKVVATTSTTSLLFIVPFLGQAKGYWQEEGLDVDWIAAGGGAKALAAVVGRSADFTMNVISPETIKAIDSGQKVKVLGIISQRGVEQVVLRKTIADRLGVSEKSSLADRAKALKGLNVATTSAGGSGYDILKALLVYGNVNPERDLTTTFIGDTGALLAAFRQGQVDVISQAPPITVEVVTDGSAVMLLNVPAGQLPERGDAAHTGLTALQQTIDTRPEILDAALRAVWRAERYFHQDKTGATAALKTLEFYSEINAVAFNKSIEYLSEAMPKEPVVSTKQHNDLMSYHNSLITKAEDRSNLRLEEVFDMGPALRAKQQLGF